MGDLNQEQTHALERLGDFIGALDTTEMVKSYKMLVLLAMIDADRFPGSIPIADLATYVEHLASRTARVHDDVGSAVNRQSALIRLLEQNPIAAWTAGRGTGGVSYFAYEGGVFSTTFAEASLSKAALQELVRELAEWRLAQYLDRVQRDKAGFTTLKVSHTKGKPILFLPGEPERSDLPGGETEVQIDESTYQADFAKIAINVIRKSQDDKNELPRILRGWFGPDAGAPGTRHAVSLRLEGSRWHLAPIGSTEAKLKLWQRYSREQIPPLFGLKFSEAIWNTGYVKQGKHMFLLTTLDKAGHGKEFQYQDRFVGTDRIEWQSQNKTTQRDRDGQDIRGHHDRGIAVHLFVRAVKKGPAGSAAPFVYCGDVSFESWTGDEPITVTWKLADPVPERLRKAFKLER